MIDLATGLESRRPVSLAASLAAVALLFFLGCDKSADNPVASQPVEAVVYGELLRVDLVPWATTTRSQGSLVADETTTLSAKIAGRVESIYVDIGDSVEPSQVLVQLDPTDFRLLAEQSDAQLQQARAAVGLGMSDPVEQLDPENSPPVQEAKALLDESIQSLTRLVILATGDAITKSDLELAESAERVARARYQSSLNAVREKIAMISVQAAQRDLAYEQLRETKITSPFEGVVQARMVAPGTFVQAGQSLLAIVRNKQLRFRTSVPERYAHMLKLGQRLTINFDLSRQVREGVVSRINPNLDPTNRSLGYEVDLDNSDGSLRSGLFGEAVIELDPTTTTIAVPQRSILRFAGVDKVWKVNEQGEVSERVVLLGAKRGDLVEIRNGLSEGETILLDASLGTKGRWAGEVERIADERLGESQQTEP
ncbi:efflux RND transporter periplasmic adaptor subunit [Pirellulaceae bacterium SH449]